jgi:hypothetical protein
VFAFLGHLDGVFAEFFKSGFVHIWVGVEHGEINGLAVSRGGYFFNDISMHDV